MKAQQGSGAMFDRIADRYDFLNRVIGLGMDQSWRRALVDAIAPVTAGDEVLDVATGTADIALSLSRRFRSVRVTGLDPSAQMLAKGQDKVDAFLGGDPSADIDLVLGDAQAMPFDDGRFAGATIAFGIRNVPDRRLGLSEMARVTRSGGKVAVLELGTPNQTVFAPIARFHAFRVVPTIGALLSGDDEYAYLAASIQAFPSNPEFVAMMEDAGLKDVSVRSFALGAANLFVGTAA